MITFINNELEVVEVVDNLKNFGKRYNEGYMFIIRGMIHLPGDPVPTCQAIKNLLAEAIDKENAQMDRIAANNKLVRV